MSKWAREMEMPVRLKSALYFSVAVLLQVSASSVQAQDKLPPLHEIAEKITSGLVYIEATAQDDATKIDRTATGTGFLISKDGTILTALHVISQLGKFIPETLRISVRFKRKTSTKIEAILEDAKSVYDLAKIKIKNSSDLPEDARPLALVSANELDKQFMGKLLEPSTLISLGFASGTDVPLFESGYLKTS